MVDDRREVTLASRVEFSGRRLTVRTDLVRSPDGRDFTREVVDPGHAVCIVPVDERGRVLLVEQYRYPVGETLLEVCAGGIHPGEDPVEAANRELQEETGHRAGKLWHMASFWLAPGYSMELMHAYLATDLVEATGQPDEDEAITTRWLALDEVHACVERGEIRDAKSIAALLLAARMLGT